jgi:hypothetical protein
VNIVYELCACILILSLNTGVPGSDTDCGSGSSSDVDAAFRVMTVVSVAGLVVGIAIGAVTATLVTCRVMRSRFGGRVYSTVRAEHSFDFSTAVTDKRRATHRVMSEGSEGDRGRRAMWNRASPDGVHFNTESNPAYDRESSPAYDELESNGAYEQTDWNPTTESSDDHGHCETQRNPAYNASDREGREGAVGEAYEEYEVPEYL